MRTAYKVRAYPDPEQTVMLARTFGCVRVVWNRTLAARSALYSTTGVSTSYRESDAALTAMKRQPDLDWLNEVSSVPLQQTLRHQHAAFGAFFAKRSRYPRFKSRRGKQSATYTRSAFRWRDGQLTLAKTASPLRLAWSWPNLDPASLDPATVSVSRDQAGRWFVVLHVDVPDPVPLPATGSSVGVDLGLKDFAVLSTGERIAHPNTFRTTEQRLARYQRQLARKKRGSANRVKAKTRVARQHAKISDARRDFLHKTSTRLVREHDRIAVEDLAVANMVRNRSLAKSISDSGWADFRAMLTYKAHRYGRTLVVVDRWYPSSKTCSACGHLLASLRLGTRHWTCPGCGTRHDRDVNAAQNVNAAGRAVALRGEVCGGDVRRHGATRPQTPVKQKPSGAILRIPVVHGGE